jgi:hypothetical protein
MAMEGPKVDDAKQEAAQSLRDDPTFAKMGEAEKLAEARFAALALHMEPTIETLQDIVGLADLLDVSPPPAPALTRRAHIPLKDAPAPDPKPAPKAEPKPEPPVNASPVVPPVAAITQNRASILYRFKLATGVSDAFISEIIGMPRSTVQACMARRVIEKLSIRQTFVLAENLRVAKSDIEALLTELES